MKWAGIAAAALLVTQTADAGNRPVTLPRKGFLCSDSLCARLPDDGKFVFEPDGPGFVDHDGALGIKFGWVRKVPGELLVGGRRLAGQAAPARAYVNDGYGDRGFQPVYLVFPTPGCWVITGGIGTARLTFVVLVEQIGDGPPWRYSGPEPGWRVARRPDE